MPVRPPKTAWDAAYDADLDAQILVRVRWGVILCLAALTMSMIDLTLEDSLEAHTRLRFLYGFAAVAILVAAATLAPGARRWARQAGLGFAVAIVLGLLGYAHTVPGGIAVAAASFTALTMGCAILFPWGARYQIAVAAVVALAFGLLSATSDVPVISALLSVVVSTAVVSTVGAALLDRYRRSSFARSWQQERLVALGRALQERPGPTVPAAIAEHALSHLPAAVVSLAVRRPDEPVFRVEAVAGPAADRHPGVHGFEVPVDSPILAEICARPHLLMPADAPGTALAALFAAHPGVCSLYVALRHGADIEGIIAWTRVGTTFSAAEIELAEHFGSQAALGLRTANAIADLQQMNRLKSEFVSTVSHELRTPLNVILGYTEMARDPDMDAAERQVFLDRIDTAGRELLDLIESTLEVGRLEAAQSPVRLEPVKLSDFWSELGMICGKTPRAAEVRLLWEQAEPLTVVTDPHKLSVITRNLVGNACKFTQRGEVRARLCVEDETLVLEVTDTGIGISPADQQVIFELFRQGDSSDSRRFGGTGLGLYIVQRFCEQLGGSVSLASELGAGARFTIRVPVSRGRAAQQAA